MILKKKKTKANDKKKSNRTQINRTSVHVTRNKNKKNTMADHQNWEKPQ